MKEPLQFADLFAGIGGFHLAFEKAGSKCVFVSEWDEDARATYKHNFKKRAPEIFSDQLREQQFFLGDITKVTTNPQKLKSLPEFDILCAGFPCQPFSNAGLKKGLQETRGTLFFDILKILKTKQPEAFFLENVRGLLTHKSSDGIETMPIIRRQLAKAGYHFSEHIVRASDFGVPQHRPRLFIIGFRSKEAFERFKSPKPIKLKLTLDQIMGGSTGRTLGYTLRVGGRGSGVGDRRNWDRYLVDGLEVRLSPAQGLKLQGFPSWFKFPKDISDTQALKQLGNSVAVPAVHAYAKAMIQALRPPHVDQADDAKN